MGSSKKRTVGYKYYLGMHLILAHGPVDRLMRIRVDKKNAWLGDQKTTGQITVAAEDLFGGKSREGGVSGKVDVEMGLPTQGKNSYLLSQLGADLPNFRRVVGMVLRQVYTGLNPYLKTWDFRLSRVHTRQDGIAQWYDSKAEILGMSGLSSQLGPTSDGWSYLQVPLSDTTDRSAANYDDSGWPTGQSPFASSSGHPYAASTGFPAISNTPWALNTKLWIRRKFNLDTNTSFKLTVFIDNFATVWVNGHQVLPRSGTIDTPSGPVFTHEIQVPSGILNVGENVIAMLGEDYGSYTYAGFKVAASGLPQYDMNPAHIIRECLTDPDWGMGYQDTDIDNASFMAAADALYDEEMGISLLWDRQTPIQDFIDSIVNHISATLFVDRTTGKFRLKLIRGDYDKEDLLQLGPDNIQKLENAKRPTFGELVNSISAVYWNAETGEDASVTVQDQALIQMQGAVINTTVQFPGFTNATIASKAALRSLQSLSTPLLSADVYADRTASGLNIGDVFRLTWPDLEIDDLVVRVTAMALGDGRSNVVKLTVIEDAFSFPEVATVSPSDPVIDNPVTPILVDRRDVFEVPYLELVQQMSQTVVDAMIASKPEIGYVGAGGVRPLSGVINARMMVDPGSGYEDVGAMEFCPGATLDVDIDPNATTFAIRDGVDLDQIVLDTWFEMDDEIMAVTAVTDTSITVKRGCLDTTPKAHSAGAHLIFWDAYAAGDETEYVTSDQLDVKLLTVAGGGQLAESLAPVNSITIQGRAARPYPPARVTTNGTFFPKYIRGALSHTWVHRNRVQQTAGPIGFLEGSITPEAGTTYQVQLYGETGALVQTYTGIAGTSQSWTTEAADSNFYGQGAAIYHNESFATQLPAGYGTLQTGGGSTQTVTYDASTGAIVLNNPTTNQTVYEITSLPYLYDMDVEFDLELLQDYNSPAYRHIGFWFMAAEGAPRGIRIARLETNTNKWIVARWNTSSWGTQVDIVPTPQPPTYAPTVEPNQRRRLRVVWSASDGLFVFYIDGTEVFRFTDTTFKRLRPGLFAYNSQVRLHEVRVNGHEALERLNNRVRSVIASSVSGRLSYQPYDYTATRVGYGYSYGLSYGGL